MSRSYRSRNLSRIELGPQPKILVIKLASLGDMLLATPALRAIHERYPDGRIDVLTTQNAASLVRCSPLVARTITLDKYAFDTPQQLGKHPWHLFRLLPDLITLRRERYDAALLFHHLTLPFGRRKYRALLWAVHARYSVGLDNGHGGFLDVRVADRGFGAQHEAQYALTLAQAIGAEVAAGTNELRLRDLGWPEGRAPCTASPRPLIALHPGSGNYSTARRWPVERFAEVAQTLHRMYDARLVLVGEDSERDLHYALLTQLGNPEWTHSEAGTTSPRALAGLLGNCALLIANDSFPMHLAAAVGTPVVAIFGPSNAQAWAPWSPGAPDRVEVIRRDDLPCSPCIYRGHSLGTPQGCPPRSCLSGLETQVVLQAAHRLLRAQGIVASRAG